MSNLCIILNDVVRSVDAARPGVKAGMIVVAIGSAIGLAIPAFAEQKAIADVQLVEQLKAHSKGWDDALNSNSIDAVLALYTDDAVEVTNQGPIVGREAIKKRYEELMKLFHTTDHVGKVYHSYMIGTDGNTVWSDGEYTFKSAGKDGAPVSYKGYWSSISVREGGVWKDRMQTWNVLPTPGPSVTPADVSGKPKPD
jgi:ketosteroid isomerase-like protein